MPAMRREFVLPRSRRLVAGIAAAAAALSPFALTAAPAAAAPSSRAVIDGPDVASYQHPYGKAINWHRVAASHKDFAIIKATEGTSYRNPWFHRDYVGAWRAGLVRGSYHFARPAYPIVRTAQSQARFFAAHLGNTAMPRTLPPALDLESTGGLGRGALVTWAQTFLLQTRKLTGRTPLIYTYPSFWTGALGDPAALARYPLWMASYSGPADPSATLWQFTSGAHVAGIRGQVDLSRFMGPEDVWASLRDGRTPTPWPAETPGAPLHVTPTPADGQVSLTWMPGDTGSTRVVHYRVTATPVGALEGASDADVVVSGASTHATVTGLANGTAYTFQVAATNSHGDGEPSNVTDPVTPMVPTALSVGGPTSTNYGGGVRVRVRLTRPDRSHGLPDRPVQVEQRVHDGSTSGWTVSRTVNSDAHGWVTIRLPHPQHNVDLRFTYDGPKGWRTATKVVAVTVHNRVTGLLSRHRVRRGHVVRMSGRISPAAGGVRVLREIFYSHRWHVLASTTTGTHGHYVFTFTPTVRTVSYYRTVVAGFGGRSSGASKVRVLRVR